MHDDNRSELVSVVVGGGGCVHKLIDLCSVRNATERFATCP
jgi:hypothetical protein